jgi:hypothetical protein
MEKAFVRLAAKPQAPGMEQAAAPGAAPAASAQQ